MQSSLLILGAGPIAERLIEELEALDSPPFTVLGVVDNQPPERSSPVAERWLGTGGELDDVVARVRPSRRVVALE